MELVRNRVTSLISWIDPRYYVVINHIILISSGMLLMGIRRTFLQVVVAIVVAVVTELVMSRLTMKQKVFLPYDRLLSAVVLALSTIILVRASYDWWFYGFVSFVGVMSKYVILNHKGRHIYNPTNVAVVFAVLVFPEHVNVRIDSFYGEKLFLFCVLFFGTLAAINAKSWRAPLGYITGMLAIGIPVGAMMGYPWLLVIGPEINVAILIFLLLMITDPQTCPRMPWEQFIYGVLIAMVNLVFRYHELYYSQFLALFLVLSFGCVLFRSSRAYIGKE